MGGCCRWRPLRCGWRRERKREGRPANTTTNTNDWEWNFSTNFSEGGIKIGREENRAESKQGKDVDTDMEEGWQVRQAGKDRWADD